MGAHSNCLEFYKTRASWKEERHKKDNTPYTQRKAKWATKEYTALKYFVSRDRKSTADYDQMNTRLNNICVEIMFSKNMPSSDANANLYCVNDMLGKYKDFAAYIVNKNNRKEYCQHKELGWFKKMINANKAHLPKNYTFNLYKEFNTYFFNVYKKR